MDKKKELAEAGRRKLEEFRKAKAAGKSPAKPPAASAGPQPAATADLATSSGLAAAQPVQVAKEPVAPNAATDTLTPEVVPGAATTSTDATSTAPSSLQSLYPAVLPSWNSQASAGHEHITQPATGPAAIHNTTVPTANSTNLVSATTPWSNSIASAHPSWAQPQPPSPAAARAPGPFSSPSESIYNTASSFAVREMAIPFNSPSVKPQTTSFAVVKEGAIPFLSGSPTYANGNDPFSSFSPAKDFDLLSNSHASAQQVQHATLASVSSGGAVLPSMNGGTEAYHGLAGVYQQPATNAWGTSTSTVSDTAPAAAAAMYGDAGPAHAAATQPPQPAAHVPAVAPETVTAMQQPTSSSHSSVPWDTSATLSSYGYVPQTTTHSTGSHGYVPQASTTYTIGAYGYAPETTTHSSGSYAYVPQTTTTHTASSYGHAQETATHTAGSYGYVPGTTTTTPVSAVSAVPSVPLTTSQPSAESAAALVPASITQPDVANEAGATGASQLQPTLSADSGHVQPSNDAVPHVTEPVAPAAVEAGHKADHWAASLPAPADATPASDASVLPPTDSQQKNPELPTQGSSSYSHSSLPHQTEAPKVSNGMAPQPTVLPASSTTPAVSAFLPSTAASNILPPPPTTIWSSSSSADASSSKAQQPVAVQSWAYASTFGPSGIAAKPLPPPFSTPAYPSTSSKPPASSEPQSSRGASEAGGATHALPIMPAQATASPGGSSSRKPSTDGASLDGSKPDEAKPKASRFGWLFGRGHSKGDDSQATTPTAAAAAAAAASSQEADFFAALSKFTAVEEEENTSAAAAADQAAESGVPAAASGTAAAGSHVSELQDQLLQPSLAAWHGDTAPPSISAGTGTNAFTGAPGSAKAGSDPGFGLPASARCESSTDPPLASKGSVPEPSSAKPATATAAAATTFSSTPWTYTPPSEDIYKLGDNSTSSSRGQSFSSALPSPSASRPPAPSTTYPWTSSTSANSTGANEPASRAAASAPTHPPTTGAGDGLPTTTTLPYSSSTPSSLQGDNIQLDPPANTTIASSRPSFLRSEESPARPSFLSGLPPKFPGSSTLGTTADDPAPLHSLGSGQASLTSKADQGPPLEPPNTSNAASAPATGTTPLGQASAPSSSASLSLLNPTYSSLTAYKASGLKGGSSTNDYLSSYGGPLYGSGGSQSSKAAPSFLESYLDNLLKSTEPAQPATAIDSATASVAGDAAQPGEAAAGEDGVQAEGSAAAAGKGSPARDEAGEDFKPESGQLRADDLPPLRRHTSIESVSSFDHSRPPPGPLGAPSSSATPHQVKALQQHIMELTEEKLELQRGLAQQAALNAGLSEENMTLAEQYNTQAKLVEELKKKVQQYSLELEAQGLALEGMAQDRDAARVNMQEASGRAAALAAEVVGLEQQLLQLKSDKLRMQREVEEGRARAEGVSKQLAALQRKSSEAEEEVQRLNKDKRELLVKLKQTEAKLQQLVDAGGLTAAAAALAAGGLPHPKVHVDQEVQCEPEQPGAVSVPLATSLPTPAAEVAEGSGEHAPAAPSAVQRASISGAAGRGAATGELSGALLVLDGRGVTSAPPPHSPGDVPSVVLAERALAQLQAQGVNLVGHQPSSEALALLDKWLPRGPVSCLHPVAAMADEEIRLVNSIHTMLGEYEMGQQALAMELEGLKAINAELRRSNEDLRSKLELQTQRLELSHSLSLASALHLSSSADVVPSDAVQHTPSASQTTAVAVTGVSGVQDTPGSAALQADYNASTAPLSLGSLAAASPETRASWLGFLFRSRPKKRVRNALL